MFQKYFDNISKDFTLFENNSENICATNLKNLKCF